MHVIYTLTHPIQYQSPLIRHLVTSGMDLEVVYGSDTTSRAYHDTEFGREVSWDVPLLEGYPHTFLQSDRANLLSQLHAIFQSNPSSAVWIHGWSHPVSKAAWRAAREARRPLLVRGETFLGCVRGGAFRRVLHRLIYRHRFQQVTAFLAVGKLNRELYLHYGVPAERIFDVPYAVDNSFFQQRATAAHMHRLELRAQHNIRPEQAVVLFCAKLIPKKDPATLIRAIASLRDVKPVPPCLVIVGDGEMRSDLEQLARKLAPDRIRFLGFQNQSSLPALYDMCDVFVLPSLFEPWGLVVNEVMNAGKPVIASDQVGSAADLVQPGINGAVFDAGNADALAASLRPYISDIERCTRAGKASLERINQWSFDQDLQGVAKALCYLERRQ